jgi:hypothetical protein
MQIFTPREHAWTGGHYVLGMEFANRCRGALSRLWNHPSLSGCYLLSDVEPSGQERIPIDGEKLHRSLYGVCTVPNGRKIACGTAFSMSADGVSWWIEFFVPLSSLRRVYPVGGYPYNCGPDYDGNWLAELEHWLVKIGTFVFETDPFKLGVVGFEPRFGKYAGITVAAIPAQSSETILVNNMGSLEVFGRTRP